MDLQDFIKMKLRALRNLYSHYTVEDNYASTQEVLTMLEHMNITARASEIDSYGYNITFNQFLIIYNDFNTIYLLESLRRLDQQLEIELDTTSLDYFLIFNTSESEFAELYRHYDDDDFYSSVVEDLELNEAGYMYPIMYKSRVMEIIYKYISKDIYYKIIL